MLIKNILILISAYLIGSIPWGLVIGLVFFKKDIRQYGSHNLGGTNAGRVLGTPIGILVILLDASKAFIIMAICNSLKVEALISELAGLFVCLGHCFPIFANFKGGKAVACAMGYVLGISVFITHEYLVSFIVPMTVFFILVIITRMVSLGSMSAALTAGICEFILGNIQIGIMVTMLSLFIIYRHKANIQRIINGTESKLGNKTKNN